MTKLKKSLIGMMLVFAFMCLSLGYSLNVYAYSAAANKLNTNYTLSGNGAEDIYAVAKAQLNKKYPEFSGFNYRAWCADFVSACAAAANVSDVVPGAAAVTNLRANIVKVGGMEYSKAQIQNGNYTPVRGDIIIFKSNGDSHVGIVDKAENGKIYYIDGNNTTYGNGNNACVHYSNRAYSYAGFTCVVKPKYKNNSAPAGNSPFGHLDFARTEMGKIIVRGWAADMDVPNEPIDVHIYAICDGVREGIGILKADIYRPDVHAQNSNINEYHGFEATINTNLTGDVQIEAYGINVGSGGNSMLEDSPQMISVPKDTIAPTISNVMVTDLSASGYTVTCNIEDNVEVSRVRFATWTEQNGQDDIIWSDEVLSNNTVSYTINTTDHNNENNCVYYTHIYAYDLAGNEVGYPVAVYVDAEPPVISNVEISDVSSLGYTITCNVSDNKEISKVRFATWTEENGQDDIVWNDGIISGNKVSCRINVSDHNNETNDKYWTHIYAYDTSNNVTGYPALVYIDGKAPIISNIEIVDISENGYTVKCTVEDDYSGVDKVLFPTWFDDDSIYTDKKDWSTNSEIIGKLENGKYVYHVNISDYKNQLGIYNTHIYAWDKHGNRSECYPLRITIKENHKHNYRSIIRKNPTCVETGIMLYECKDGDDSYEEEIPATGHQHTELKNASEATCAQEGYTGDTYCKDCGTKLSSGETIAKTDHIWDSGKITKEATCKESGTKTYTCTSCNTTKIEEIPATGNHQNTELRNVKEATCAQEGYTGDTYCKDCGTKLSSGKTIAKTDHTWDAGKITKVATCTESGTQTYTCTSCNTTRTEEIPATGNHQNTEVRNVKEATCLEEGYTGDTYCKDCGTKLSSGKTVSKKDHTWDSGKILKAATCKEAGIKTYTCTSCNTTRLEEIPATGNHQNTELRNVKEATCAQEGYTGDTYCKDCGEKLSSGKTIAKTDHIWDSGRITKPATDTESGIKTYTCINCNTTRTEEIPATGEHLNTELRGAKSATCLEEGYTGDTYCKDCGTKLSSGTVIPKTGHIWDEGVVTKATTCTEKGIRTYTCSVCESTKIEEIPPTGHGTKITKFAKEATYTQEGYTGDIYCQDCGTLLEEGKVLAKLEQPKQTVTPGEMIGDKASNGVYKVLADGRSVEFVRQMVQSKAVKIPDTVSINGTIYAVTGISANAFKNNQLLRTTVIGRNVRRIGKQAFYNCKNLRTITIRTSMLTKKNIGTKAFKGTYKKIKVKVPAKQFKTYKKFFKSKGMSTKAIYKK